MLPNHSFTFTNYNSTSVSAEIGFESYVVAERYATNRYGNAKFIRRGERIAVAVGDVRVFLR